MDKKESRYCEDVKKEFNIDFRCCQSCHEDADLEDFLLDQYDQEDFAKKIEGNAYFLCCGAVVALKEEKILKEITSLD